jgi:hypothetical protein
MELTTVPGKWAMMHYYDERENEDQPERWEIVGSQSISGRTNAIEEFQSDFKEHDLGGCGSWTVQMARWRDTTPPALNSSRDVNSTSGNPFLGSVSHTINTCGGGNNDPTYSRRNLPQFNFATESSVPVGTLAGYVSRMSVSTTYGAMVTGERWGCFKINWFSP